MQWFRVRRTSRAPKATAAKTTVPMLNIARVSTSSVTATLETGLAMSTSLVQVTVNAQLTVATTPGTTVGEQQDLPLSAKQMPSLAGLLPSLWWFVLL